jgi:hypothetical protein
VAVAIGQVNSRELRRLGLVPLLPLWAAGIYVAWYAVSWYSARGLIGMDAHAYWLTAHDHQLYGAPPMTLNAFLYSPAFALLISPIAQLPWLIFAVLWITAEVVAFAWLLAPWGWRWAVPLLLLCTVETALGNIYAWLAVAAVLGMSRPGAWCFPLLTKITPGIGILWFAARGERRHLGTALGVTLMIAAISFAIAPQSWIEWIHFIFTTPRSPALLLPYRIAGGVLVAIVAARTNRPRLLALAMFLASPVIAINSLTILAAVPRLLEAQTSSSRDAVVVET